VVQYDEMCKLGLDDIFYSIALTMYLYFVYNIVPKIDESYTRVTYSSNNNDCMANFCTCVK